MLKQGRATDGARQPAQPPLGGCVLKQNIGTASVVLVFPAAFRRLCVETDDLIHVFLTEKPAAFRRLCVETVSGGLLSIVSRPSRL